MNRPSGDERDVMRRRAFILDTLSAAGLVIAPGVIDSAARLNPVDVTGQARKIAHLEASVHAHLGYPRDAARHATQTLLSLQPECAVPVLLDRADEVADLIGTAGRSDTEDLRQVLRRTRIIEST